MKPSHVLLGVILFAVVAAAQPPDTVWTQWRGRTVINSICVRGNEIFAGGANGDAINMEAYYTNGEMDWSYTLGTGTHSNISGVETSNSGALYVVGTIEHDNVPDEMLLSRFTMQWGIAGQIDLSAYGAFRGDQIKRNAVGEMFVAGKGMTDTVRSLLFKLSTTGDTLWSYSSFDAFSYPWGDIAPAADGGCFLCDANGSVRLRKISAAGQLEWDSSYAAPTQPWFTARAASLGSGDIVVGYADEINQSLNVFFKFSPTGELLATRSYTTGGEFTWYMGSLTASGDRLLCVTKGVTDGAPLLMMDSDLDSLWSYTPTEHGIHWGDVEAAAFTPTGDIVFSIFDFYAGGWLVMLGNPLSTTDGMPELPTMISLGAYPNPFNSSTTLNLQLPVAADIRMTLVDMLGRRVMDKAEHVSAGEHHYALDGTALASGIYFANVQAGSNSRTIRLVMVK